MIDWIDVYNLNQKRIHKKIKLNKQIDNKYDNIINEELNELDKI